MYLILGLYGRDAQLKVLMETFRATQLSGTSGVCCVTGSAGAGKTYLVRHAMEQMKQEGAIITSAKLEQYNEHIPYTAIASFV